MNPLIIQALIDLGLKLSPLVIEALAVWIQQIIDDSKSSSFVAVAQAIVLGIERDYGNTTSGSAKYELAFAAIKRTPLEDGTFPTDGMINRAIEIYSVWARVAKKEGIENG